MLGLDKKISADILSNRMTPIDFAQPEVEECRFVFIYDIYQDSQAAMKLWSKNLSLCTSRVEILSGFEILLTFRFHAVAPRWRTRSIELGRSVQGRQAKAEDTRSSEGFDQAS